MTKFTNRKEIRYVCGNRLVFHIFIISACSRNVKYILTKIRSCARQLFARCRRGDSRARRRTCSPYKPPSKWQTPPDLSLRGGRRPTWRPEREARGSALGVQSRSTRLNCGKAISENAAASPRLGLSQNADCKSAAPLKKLDKSRENPGLFGFSRLNCLANFRKFNFETSPFLRKKG